MAKKAAKKETTGANIGFETKLWLAADKLRSNMDASEYKHVVLGLIFLKYISDTFDEHHATLVAGKGQYEGANPEDPDEYKAENVFWIPQEARWTHLQAHAKQPTIGKLVDDAMVAIERDNLRLKGVLPKDYARPALDKHRLGELIDLVGTILLVSPRPRDGGEGQGEGADKSHRAKDILGRVYEYFLTQFASAEGKNGGQFYTPSCVVRVLVEMLAPYKGRIYDPCCGSGGMFVQSEKFVEAHGGKIGDISIYGQESNSTTRRLAVMNLALRGIEADFGPEHADTFRRDLHPDLRADYVLANGSMSANQSGEGEIRKSLIEADLVDCLVAMPRQLFYSTQIPVCLWFLTKNKKASPGRQSGGKFRDHRGETLFIDARKLGTLIDRVHRELTDVDINKIVHTYHAWRGDAAAISNLKSEISNYQDIPGFCKSATTAEIAAHGHVLTPGRYVGAEEVEDDGDPFEEKMPRLVAELHAQFAESAKLEEALRTNLRQLGFESKS